MRLGKWRLKRTTIISTCLISLLIGLGLGRKIYLDPSAILIPLLLIVTRLRRRGVLLFGSLVAVFVLLGIWRGNIFLQKVKIYQRLKKSPVIIRAIADSDAVYAEKSQLSFDVTNIRLEDPVQQTLIGKIAVKGFGEPMVYKGDTVQVEGKLYPTRGSKQASISYADLKIIKSGSSRIDTIRRRFAAGMSSALPAPLGPFGLGLLIGQRTTLPQNLNDQLSVVGLTHIVAVSGYNLTIIVLVAHRLMKQRSKYQATVLSLLLIGIFLLFTGSSASIVRAAIVSMLSLLAWYYGRRFKPSLLILLAASLITFWYPLYLWSDLGWWLSFLAFGGVLVVGPIITRRLWHTKEPRLLIQVLIETTSAQLMTLPLIMYIFGKLSLIALVANMLVVPLVPLAMLLCLIAGLAGMLMAPVAGWFAWPARVLMSYMVDLISLLAKLPHALVLRKLRLDQMLLLYGLIGIVMLIGWQKASKNSRITDRTELKATGVT